MTEKLDKSGLREDYFISKRVDGILDGVARDKTVRLLLGIFTGAGVGSTAGCVSVTPSPAEVVPMNEASLSGVIGQDSVDKLSGNSKIIVENSLNYIANKYAEDEKYVPGTEMIYAVAKGTDSFAYYLAGFKNKDGSVGLRVTDYCEEWLRDNENCQDIGEDLRMVEGGGNRIYGFVDKNNKQHPILLIDKNNNPVAFDINGSSYAERAANSQGFVDKIVSIGAMNVQAAAEVTVTPSSTATAEPTATATKEPTATPTEIPLIEGNIFFDPQSEADLDKVVKAPSPIDNPKEFAVWQDEYLRQVNEGLKTYEGNIINGSYTGVNFNGAYWVIRGGEFDEGEMLEVVASYQFEWRGNRIVTKTYVMETRHGSLVPFSVTYSNLPRKNNYGLVTPSGKVTVWINYDYVVNPAQIEDPFSESYFEAQKDNIDVNTKRRFLSGLSGDEVEKDRESFSRMPFVLWAYLDCY